MPKTPLRPPALTIACIFIGVASGLLLGSMVSVLGSWNSIDTQESIRSSLDDPALRDLGVGVETVRWLFIGIVPFAVAGIVFAVFAVRGHRSSRWFLTALCGLGAVVAVSTGLFGLLPAAMLFLCAFTLWSPDSRRWFDAVNGRAVAVPAGPRAQPGVHPASQQAGPAVNVPTYDPATQTYATQQAPAPAPHGPPAVAGSRRPRALDIAAWTTIGFSAVVLLGSAMGLLVSTVGADAYRDAAQESATVRDLLRDGGVSIDTLLTYMRWLTAVSLAVSLLGLGAGLASLTGRRAALIFLWIMAGATIALSLASFPVGIPTGIAAVVVLVQSLKPEVRAWSELS